MKQMTALRLAAAFSLGLCLTAPAMAAFAGEVTVRYSATVWERAAASAVPLVGAVGGASLNVIVTNHFNSIAWGHFTVRRLERIYGEELVAMTYARLVAEKRLLKRIKRRKS